MKAKTTAPNDPKIPGEKIGRAARVVAAGAVVVADAGIVTSVDRNQNRRLQKLVNRLTTNPSRAN
jgi:hypothetical protein